MFKKKFYQGHYNKQGLLNFPQSFSVLFISTCYQRCTEEEWIQFQGKQLCQKYISLPCRKGSTLIENSLLRENQISFLLEQTPFPKGHDIQVNKCNTSKVVTLVKITEDLQSVSILLNHLKHAQGENWTQPVNVTLTSYRLSYL